MNEAQFQSQVVALAKLQGWRVAHFRPAQNARGDWRTPVAADGAGFPDLVLARDRVIFAELKSDTGRLSVNQLAWLDALERARVEHYVWRPQDWPAIEAALRRATPTA